MQGDEEFAELFGFADTSSSEKVGNVGSAAEERRKALARHQTSERRSPFASAAAAEAAEASPLPEFPPFPSASVRVTAVDGTRPQAPGTDLLRHLADCDRSSEGLRRAELPRKPQLPLEEAEAMLAVEELLAEVRQMATQHEVPDQEQLWHILSELERVKSAPSAACCRDFTEVLHAVEEAVLPLICAVEQQQRQQHTPPCAHTMREVAGFDEQLRLVLQQEGWEQVRQNSSKQRISSVVGLLGDTHVGKSTLLGQLLGTSAEGPAVAVPQQNAPTTAGVNVFDSDIEVADVTRLRFLDMEGENGSLPPALAAAAVTNAQAAMGAAVYQARRRERVAETLPRLAFVTCDVVVYVSNESFASAAYMQRVRKLAFDSTESVDSALSPALVLVYNQCSLDEEFDIDACTKTFFENEENEEIRQLYSEVVCVSVPHRDLAKRLRNGDGQRCMIIDGEEIFQLQVAKLRSLLQQLVHRRLHTRDLRGSIFSEHVWCILVKQVLATFQHKLRMADLLTSIVKPRSPIAGKAFNYFSDLYRYAGSYSRKQFLLCRSTAVAIVAFLFVEHVRMKQLEYDRFIINSLRSEAFRQEIASAVGELVVHVDKLAPCEALFEEGDGPPVGCTQERMCHGMSHRSSQKVFSATASATEPRSKRWGQKLRTWMGIGYRPVWPGVHQFEYEEDFSNVVDQCILVVEELCQTSQEHYLPTKAALLASIGSQAADSSRANVASFCWVCLTAIPSRQLQCCGHVFCGACMRALAQESAAVPPAQLPGMRELLPPAQGHCPLCSALVHSVTVYRMPYRGLQEKYLSIFTSTMLGSLAKVDEARAVQ